MRQERRNIRGRSRRILGRRVVVELRRSSGDNRYLFERSSEDNRYLCGIGAGLGGVGLSVGLSSDLSTWFGVMWHPSNWSTLILGLSSAVLCYFFLKYRRYYQKRRHCFRVATGIVMAGSIGIMVSHGFPNFPSICWIMHGLAGLFFVGVIIGIAACLWPIRTDDRDTW